MRFVRNETHPLAWRLGAIAVAVAAVIAFTWLLVVLPERQASYVEFQPSDVASKRATLINEYRRTLAQAIGGLFVIVGGISGAFFTLRQITIAREGQITERFTKAVAQLGDDKLAVRLGGIYALERIAKDSPRDHWTVVEVLSAFVRDKAPAITPRTSSGRPLPDIQAILTVLGRRNRHNEPAHINLRDTQLSHATSEGAHLEEANLVGANLEGAWLTKAHLERARLIGADLRAFLVEAHLEEATMNEATLMEAILARANLQRANLQFANLEAAVLEKAHLENADLRFARLIGAHFDEAHLEGADLTNAIGLTATDLRKAFVDETTKLPEGIALTDLRRIS